MSSFQIASQYHAGFISTIFTQIDSSVDKTRKTLALFNKDWNTYKTNWQNANGIGGKIDSIFASAKANVSVISAEQIISFTQKTAP